ncbi:MAG: PetN [Cyanobacteriota bacterium]|jgi:cytochrome b6-f complex subunit 8
MKFRRFLFGTVKRIMILRKIYLNRYKTMDILSLGWFGVLGMFTLSIAFVVWGRNGL